MNRINASARSRPRLTGGVVVVLLLVVELLTVAGASGAAPDSGGYAVDRLDGPDGFAGTVEDLLQSSDGYLWLATPRGLGRFDGLEFDVYDSRTTANTLRGNVHDVAEGRAGRLWIVTKLAGLLKFEDGMLTPAAGNSSLPEPCLENVVEGLEGTVWVSTCRQGLFRSTDDTAAAFVREQRVSDQDINALFRDSRGRVWVGGYDGLTVLEGSESRVYRKADGLAAETVFGFDESPCGTVWVGTEAGLRAFREDRIETVPEVGVQINAVRVDARGQVWFGGRGLYRLEPGEPGRVVPIGGLDSDHVFALGTTDDGSVWVGTYSGGLHRLREAAFATLGQPEGLSHDFVTTILEDDGGLWVATWGGGLNRIRDGEITTYGKSDGLPDVFVSALFRDSNGDLWAGSAGLGLHRRFADGSYRNYTTDDGLSAPGITAIAEDDQGNLWVGTTEGVNLKQGETFSRFSFGDGDPPDFIHAIVPDSRGSLWIARERGLARIRDGVAETFNSADGLAGDVVFAVHVDDEGTIWIGTGPGGLTRLRDGQFVSLTQAEGLCGEGVYWIVEHDERLWMSTDDGLFAVDKHVFEAVATGERESLPCVLYGRAAGIRDGEIVGGFQPGGIRARDGRLWFPTTAGAVSFDPRALGTSHTPPRVVLKQVLANRRILTLRGDARVPRERGELEFHFGAISFVDPRSLRFRYRLEGFDDDWNEVGAQRIARYTNLPPGEYRFRASASHGDGAWTSQEVAFAVGLQPRFYQTRGFMASAAIGLLLLALAVYFVRARQVALREQKLARLVEERTRELTAATERLAENNRRQAEFVSGVSHELKTPLTLIRLYVDTLLEHADLSRQEQEEYYRIVARESERLSYLVDRVLDLQRLDASDWTTDLETVDLRTIVARALDSYADYLKRRGFELQRELTRPCPELRVDPDAVSTAVINLIDNAAKYSGAARFIAVGVSSRNGTVVVEVRDHGPGIPDQDREKIFHKFYRGNSHHGIGGYGIGLYLVRQVMRAHDGSVEVDSEVGRGTTVRLVFPMTSRVERRAAQLAEGS